MIREARESDCINLAALSIKVWLENYAVVGIRREFSEYVFSTFTQEHFMQALHKPSCKMLVCEHNEALQGYVLLDFNSHFETPDNGFEIKKLYIDSRFKQQGIGKALLSEVAQRFGPQFWLYTWIENAANGFYQHLGFSKIGTFVFKISGQTIENNVYRGPQ